MKQIICFIALCLSVQLNASKYFLFNEGTPVVLEGYKFKKSEYSLENFRVRVIADQLYGSTDEYASKWLGWYSSIVPKTFVPHILSESGYGEIYQSEMATNKLTLLFSADGHNSDNDSVSFWLCAKDVKLRDKIGPEDMIKINIKNIYKHNNKIKIDFDILIDNEDGDGFVPLVQENNSYLP